MSDVLKILKKNVFGYLYITANLALSSANSSRSDSGASTSILEPNLRNSMMKSYVGANRYSKTVYSSLLSTTCWLA